MKFLHSTYGKIWSIILTVAMIGGFVLGDVALAESPEFPIYIGHVTTSEKKSDFVPGEVLFRYKNDTERFRVAKVSNVEQAIQALSRNPHIEYVEPNYIATIHTTQPPNDPGYVYQWNFHRFEDTGGVGAEAAWEITAGYGAVVAVIDTGVAYEDHGVYKKAPDLKDACFKDGYDYVNNDEHANDDHGHGTHVAGTIAQTTNNNEGVAGLAHDACIMPLKALAADGSGSHAWIVSAINFAVEHGAHVINMSFGGPHSLTLQNAIAAAHEKGVTLVAATGNSNGAIGYPAAYEEVIAVGATRKNGIRAPYSNYGPQIDLVAPGGYLEYRRVRGRLELVVNEGILQQTLVEGTTDTFAYYYYSGTSMASPHVAAAAAMVIANNRVLEKEVTPLEVRTALVTTARDLGALGWDPYYGHGLIDIRAALEWGSDDGSVVPPPPVNRAPIANAGEDQLIVVPAGEDIAVAITLDGSGSTDPDSDPLTYTWSGGDISENETEVGVKYKTTLSEIGVYVYTLTVSDGESEDSDTVTVTILQEAPQQFTLSAVGYRVRGAHAVDLSWSGTSAGTLDMYRNSDSVVEIPNTGTYTDSINAKGGGSYTYKLCEKDSSVCTEPVTVVF